MKRLAIASVLLFLCRWADAASVVQWRGEVELKKSGESSWKLLAGADVSAGPKAYSFRRNWVYSLV